MKKTAYGLTAVLLFAFAAPAAAANVIAKVDIGSQTMTVSQGGIVKYRWRVSTARAGKVTPTGKWKAKWLSKHHRSSRYKGAPMPYAIFYNGNFAVHGTNQVGRLGRPASAGCVRLDTANAATLYSLAQQVGLSNLHIVVHR